MEKIDLSILKQIPQLTVKAELQIEPLAPLSMVSELPGSFYKTMKKPDKKMVCGLIENILSWHIDLKDRKKIASVVKIARKKNKIEYQNYVSGSTFIPLLMDYFDILDNIEISFTEICFYNDLWSRSYRRSDSSKHINGSRFMDALMIEKWAKIKLSIDKDKKRSSTAKNTLLDKLFIRYIGKFPQYYSSPTVREYIHLNGTYNIPLIIDERLYSIMKIEIAKNNIGYLGNSEGWVNLNLIEL